MQTDKKQIATPADLPEQDLGTITSAYGPEDAGNLREVVDHLPQTEPAELDE